MAGTHRSFKPIPDFDARLEFWHNRHLRRDQESTQLMALSRAAIARSRELLAKTIRQLDGPGAADRVKGQLRR